MVLPTKPNSKQGAIFLINLASEVPPVVESLGLIFVIFLIISDTYQNHNTGDGHPEKIDRVTVVIDNFKKLDNKKLIWKKPNKFEISFLIKTHTSNYIDQVNKSFPKKGYNFLDGDTIVSPGSKDASKDAVGSIITAIDGVQNKEFKNAFCAVRPPGHHAEKELSLIHI